MFLISSRRGSPPEEVRPTILSLKPPASTMDPRFDSSWLGSFGSPFRYQTPLQTPSPYSAAACDHGHLKSLPGSIIQPQNADPCSASILGHSPNAHTGPSLCVSSPRQTEDWSALTDDAGRYFGVETLSKRSEEHQQVGRISRIPTA